MDSPIRNRDDNVLKKKRIQGIGEQIYAVRRNVKR